MKGKTNVAVFGDAVCDLNGRTIFFVEYNREERCWDVLNGEGINPTWGWPTGYPKKKHAIDAAIELSEDFLMDEVAKKNDNKKPGFFSGLIKGKNIKSREEVIEERVEQLSEGMDFDCWVDVDYRPNLGDFDNDDENAIDFAAEIGFDFYKAFYEENREEVEETDDFQDGEGYEYAIQGMFCEGDLTKWDIDEFIEEHTGRSYFKEMYQRRLREIASDDSEFEWYMEKIEHRWDNDNRRPRKKLFGKKKGGR